MESNCFRPIRRKGLRQDPGRVCSDLVQSRSMRASYKCAQLPYVLLARINEAQGIIASSMRHTARRKWNEQAF